MGSCISQMLKDTDNRQNPLVRMMFPDHVSKYIHTCSNKGNTLIDFDYTRVAKAHASVTIMFCDIVGFSDMAMRVSPRKVMKYLHTFFTLIDDIIGGFSSIYKVETIGDCVMCVAGLSGPPGDDATRDLFALATQIIYITDSILMPATTTHTSVRIGLHCGPVMSGVVGRLMPRFCLFGNTVNMAARLQTNARPNTICMSLAVWEKLDPTLPMEKSVVALKGIGDTDTYTFSPRASIDYKDFMESASCTTILHTIRDPSTYMPPRKGF